MTHYLRFVVEERDPSTGYRFGIMHGLVAALESADLSRSDHERLRELQRWFSEHLVKPAKFSRKRNDYHRNHRGLSWFKDSAEEPLGHSRELSGILEYQGYRVTVLTTPRPGVVVYEDDQQVVAEPFADTPT